MGKKAWWRVALAGCAAVVALGGCRSARPAGGVERDRAAVTERGYGAQVVKAPPRVRSALRGRVLVRQKPIVLLPSETLVVEETNGSVTVHFEVSWFGPQSDEDWGSVPRGMWVEGSEGAGWFVVSGYVYAFGWWPYLLTGYTTLLTQGAENCTNGTLAVALQKLADGDERHILLDRDPDDTTGPCAPAGYYATVQAGSTGATKDLTQEGTYVEYDHQTQTLSGPFDISSNPEVQEFVNFINQNAGAFEPQTP